MNPKWLNVVRDHSIPHGQVQQDVFLAANPGSQLEPVVKGALSSAMYVHPGPETGTSDALAVSIHSDNGGVNYTGNHFASHNAEVSINGDGTMTFAGTELLAPLEFPPQIGGAGSSTLPAGGIMALIPANPRFVDGSRLGNFLRNYDQFQLESVSYHYVPAASFTTAAALVMAYVNDDTEELTLTTGFQALRDYASRDGAAQFDVKSPATAHLGHPQLKWYLTATAADTALEMPGYVLIANMLDFSTATTATTPLGFVYMTYRVRVRAPAVDTVLTQQVTTRTLNSPWNQIMGSGLPVEATAATIGFPADLTAGNPAYIYWATVVAASDDAGNSQWRTWNDRSDNSTHVIGPGNVLFWRVVIPAGGGALVRFYPSFGAALDNNGQDDGFVFSVSTVVGTARGFKLWSVNAAPVSG